MPDKDWKVTLEYVETGTSRLEDTTFCVREHVADPAGNLDGDTVAADLSSWLSSTARAMGPTNVQLSQVRVFRGGPWGPGEGDPQESGNAVVNLACTGPAPTGGLPHGVCCRVSVYTSLASRRGRGRFHAPSPTAQTQLNDADHLGTSLAYYIAVKAFADGLLAGHDVVHDLITHHYSLRVHSRADQTTRDAKKVLVRTEVSYLRSRLTSP